MVGSEVWGLYEIEQITFSAVQSTHFFKGRCVPLYVKKPLNK